MEETGKHLRLTSYVERRALLKHGCMWHSRVSFM